MEPNAWNGKAHPISIFGTIEVIEINAKNIDISLLCIAYFIRSRKVNTSAINNIKKLKGFGNAAFNFVLSIYEANWDTIYTNDYNNFFRNRIINKFTPKVKKLTISLKVDSSKNKQIEIIRISSSIPTCSLKKILEKFKFFNKKDKKPMNMNKAPQELSYA